MKKSTKIILSIIGVLLVIGFLAYKIISAPHDLTDQQILERFTWTVKVDKDKNSGTAKFTNKHIEMNNQKYAYNLTDDDVMTIKNGPLKGQYNLDMDTTDYILDNVQSKQMPQKVHLIRND